MYRRKRLRELFRFRDDIRLQCLKIACLRSCSILNYCYWVGVHNQIPFFLPDQSFKICEKPSKFLQKCPRSQQLRRHCVRAVNDYANTMSAWSTTTPTPCVRCVVADYVNTCQHSQRIN